MKSHWTSGAVPLRAVILTCAAVFGAVSCGGEIPPGKIAAPRGRGTARVSFPVEHAQTTDAAENLPAPVPATDIPDMKRIVEIERSGMYVPGLALIESGLREKAGDYTGAAVAAYRELAWAYGYGSADKKQVEEGLQNALTLYQNIFKAEDSSAAANPNQDRESVNVALRGCMAFARGDWALAEELLSTIVEGSGNEEPDSFLRWMLLVCGLERDRGEKSLAARQAYGAIRARYALFPEYWYRAARAFSAGGEATPGERNIAQNIAAAYAEQCINTSPEGPFAGECRKILAEHFGISPNGTDHNVTIRTKAEIEDIIRSSVSENDPLVLEKLFPLMSLPENPFTLYAVGALKALSTVPEFRNFFAEGAFRSPGRLGERLNYIARS